MVAKRGMDIAAVCSQVYAKSINKLAAVGEVSIFCVALTTLLEPITTSTHSSCYKQQLCVFCLLPRIKYVSRYISVVCRIAIIFLLDP